MGGAAIALLVVVGLIVLIVLWLVGTYNGLIRLRNQVENAWAQIDVQLKRRYDLIPNLIEKVKGYAKHEKELLENVTKARSRCLEAAGTGNVGQIAQAENVLGGALRGLMIQIEAYPDLKANQNFLALQEELTSTENKISFSRQYYNDSVLRYNNKTQVFPSNIVAGLFGFKIGEFFEVTAPEQREAPKVSFS